VSQVLKDDLVAQGFDAHTIVVNPNGVDTQQFNPAVLCDERKSIRGQLGLQDRFVFGFVGSFSAWHGIETIAQMIPSVCRACPQAHFLLIGSGPLQGWLQEELKKNGNGSDAVTLLGIVPQAQAKNYLAACDAFLSPTKQNQDGSRFFGSPTKMFEYMSLGKPIIASDLEQLSDLLYPALRINGVDETCENKVGILVPADDVQGFISAAITLIKMSEVDRVQLGNYARRKAIEQYSWSDHTKKIMDAVYADR
jgi:glycosyltransferase involved in cell wall biosynthesis